MHLDQPARRIEIVQVVTPTPRHRLAAATFRALSTSPLHSFTHPAGNLGV